MVTFTCHSLKFVGTSFGCFTQCVV